MSGPIDSAYEHWLGAEAKEELQAERARMQAELAALRAQVTAATDKALAPVHRELDQADTQYADLGAAVRVRLLREELAALRAQVAALTQEREIRAVVQQEQERWREESEARCAAAIAERDAAQERLATTETELESMKDTLTEVGSMLDAERAKRINTVGQFTAAIAERDAAQAEIHQAHCALSHAAIEHSGLTLAQRIEQFEASNLKQIQISVELAGKSNEIREELATVKLERDAAQEENRRLQERTPEQSRLAHLERVERLAKEYLKAKTVGHGWMTAEENLRDALAGEEGAGE